MMMNKEEILSGKICSYCGAENKYIDSEVYLEKVTVESMSALIARLGLVFTKAPMKRWAAI